MKKPTCILVLLACLFSLGIAACRDKNKTPEPQGGLNTDTNKVVKTLVFSRTLGYRHESIGAGIQMFLQHAGHWNLEVATTEATLHDSLLQETGLLVLLNSTGDVFSDSEQEALKTFVHSGGSVLAIHAAADAEYNWPWYNQMLGAWFDSHPAIQEAKCLLQDAAHKAGKDMPAAWVRTDEWYNFKNIQPYIQRIYTLDESSYSGGNNGADHPISWYHSFEGGKVFYTGMGHTSETYSEPFFIQHIGGAIDWLTE